MKAIIVREFKDSGAFLLEDVAVPSPGPGELLVAIHSAAVSFGDTLIATGRYQVRPVLPFTPGTELAGIVEAVGDGVTEFKPGDKVSAMGFVGNSRKNTRILGSLAQKAIVPLRNVMRAPDHVDLEQLALFRSTTETSYFGLQEGRLAAGETLLVLGAGGGTGFAAVALGKMLGARVIASASSESKRDIALAGGADIAIDSNAVDWRQQVASFAGPRGVAAVFDPVGGEASELAFRTLGYGGRHIVVGFASGMIPRLPLNLPLLKASSVVGANLLAGWEAEPERFQRNATTLMKLFGEGKIPTPPVARRYSLAQAADALQDVATGTVAGRVVVNMEPGA